MGHSVRTRPGHKCGGPSAPPPSAKASPAGVGAAVTAPLGPRRLPRGASSRRPHRARPARGLGACCSAARAGRACSGAGAGRGTRGRACLGPLRPACRASPPAPRPTPGLRCVPRAPRALRRRRPPPPPHGPPAPAAPRPHPQPRAPPPRPGGAAMALGGGCTHLHGRHSLGHFPAQRRLLVADLLRGQSLGPAPAPAVQPQALDAQLLRLRPC